MKTFIFFRWKPFAGVPSSPAGFVEIICAYQDRKGGWATSLPIGTRSWADMAQWNYFAVCERWKGSL
jgi:hypothetical protein